jgi:hypothetical protein
VADPSPAPRATRRLPEVWVRLPEVWVAAWLGGPVIGIVNGSLREALYRDAVGDLRAHQISTATGIGLFAAYFVALERRDPLPDDRTALRVGALWLVLTVLFEFGFGRRVARQSWEQLLADYDLRRGRLWPVVLACLGLVPLVTRRIARRRAARPVTAGP